MLRTILQISPKVFVFCNLVSVDRSVVVPFKLLGAIAACVIPLSFAAGFRKLLWGGCVKAAIQSKARPLNFFEL